MRVNFYALLFIVFMVLKLTDTIDWSWLWITAPLWIPASIAIVLILFVALCDLKLDR